MSPAPGARSPTPEAGVRVVDGRCVIDQEAFLKGTKGACRRTLAETTAQAESRCGGQGSVPVVMSCQGRRTFGYIDSQIGIGTRCTYDEATGAFLGGMISTDSGPGFCPVSTSPGAALTLVTEPIVEPCLLSARTPRLCGGGVTGRPVANVPTRPITFRLENRTGQPLLLSDPSGPYRDWRLFDGGTRLDIHTGLGECTCPNQQCVVPGFLSTRIVTVAPGSDVTWQWDGRLGSMVYQQGSSLACVQFSADAAGTRTVQVRYSFEGAAETRTAEATFQNTTADTVVVTAN